MTSASSFVGAPEQVSATSDVYYRKRADAYHAQTRQIQAELTRAACYELRPNYARDREGDDTGENAAAPKVALDLGCGSGLSTEALQQAFPNTFVIGLDRSKEMLEVPLTSSSASIAGRRKGKARGGAAASSEAPRATAPKMKSDRILCDCFGTRLPLRTGAKLDYAVSISALQWLFTQEVEEPRQEDRAKHNDHGPYGRSENQGQAAAKAIAASATSAWSTPAATSSSASADGLKRRRVLETEARGSEKAREGSLDGAQHDEDINLRLDTQSARSSSGSAPIVRFFADLRRVLRETATSVFQFYPEPGNAVCLDVLLESVGAAAPAPAPAGTSKEPPTSTQMNHIVMHYPHKEAKKKFYLVTNVVAGTERKQWSAMCWPCCAATSSISVFTVSRSGNNRDAEEIPPLVLRSRKEHLNLFSRYVRNIVKLASVSGRGAFVDDDVGPAVTKSEIRSRILHELGPVGVAVGWEIFQALRLRWRQRQKVEKTECDEITTAKFASAKDLLDDGLSDTEKIKMLHTCPPWKALEKTPTERVPTPTLREYLEKTRGYTSDEIDEALAFH